MSKAQTKESMSTDRDLQTRHAAWTPFTTDPRVPRVTAQVVRDAYEDMITHRVAPSWDHARTRSEIEAIDLSEAIGVDAALAEAQTLMQQGDLRSASATCFGYFNPTAAWPAVLGDLLAAARNPQVCLSTHAPASVAMERQVIRWFLDRLRFPDDSIGNFTSGGSEANGTALLVALMRANEDFSEQGIAAFSKRPALYVSADSHLAWIKIARAAGMGTESVRLVPTAGNGRMDTGSLERMLENDAANGLQPIMIAATAGTTSAGETDPLHACADIASRESIHYHIDAAWAGALIVDPSRRHYLDGIERADSVTIDAHKWLSVPMGAGMVFLKHRPAVLRAFAVKTGYMPEGDGVDAYVTTSQWSRRFLGIRLWMMLRSTGVEGYQAMFARHFELADRLRGDLRSRGFRILNDSPLPIVLFEDATRGLGSAAMANALEADGRAYVGCVEFEGRMALRACFTSFLTNDGDVDVLLERLEAVRG